MDSIISFIGRFRFNVWSLSGSLDGKRELRIFFSGSEIAKRLFTRLIFVSGVTEDWKGRIWLWQLILEAWRAKKCFDILLISGKIKIWRLFQSANRFIIPDWIGGEIDLTKDIETLRKSNGTAKANIRRIKRNHLDFTVTKDPALFDFFYYRMYLPYMHRRHHSRAIYRKREEMGKSFDNGELLLINKDKKFIAGVLIDYQIMKKMPRTTQVGVLHGNFSYVREGALSAIYYYSIKYLKSKGYKEFSVGTTFPFLSDGVFQHKRTWGMQIVCETKNAYLLCLLSKGRATSAFLLNHPFISMDGGEPVCTLFVDKDPSASCPSTKESKFNALVEGLPNRVIGLKRKTTAGC